jgi:cytochrome c-type biogenesis protein CcmH/NrfG
MPFPYIFTFYSFKGGVGRSMAVMNVAYTLAGRGRHVLVVDMDLEAPGLSGFLHRSGELAEPEVAHPKDILTLLGEATRALRVGGAPEEMAQRLPPLSNYIRAVAEKKLEALQPKLGKLGHLDVLGTDPERDYMGRLAQLDLKGLPQDQLIALSRLLHHYFKAQRFPHRPLGVETFEPPLQTSYDYILVDSRTGITELGGLCVGPLADRLVVITGLNDQNVHGTLDFLKEAGIQPKPRPKDDQPWDDADTVGAAATDNPSLGPKPTILVASPVPDGEITYKRQRLSELEKLIGIHPVSLSYHSLMALMETVFVRDYPEEKLASEYKKLATSVMAQVGDDPQRLAAEIRVLWNEKKDLGKAIARALRLASDVPELGITMLTLLERTGRESDGNHVPEMRQLYAALSQNAETRVVALTNWGVEFSDQAKTKAAEVADRLFEEAGRKYSEALRLKPDHHTALNNWGVALYEQAKTKAGEEAHRLLEEAGRKHSEALRLKPDLHEALSNWGNALSDQAKTKAGQEADRLFEEAGCKYAEALRFKPDYHEALFNWGAALSDQAKAKAGEEADRLLGEAGHKYAEALRLKPDFPEALSNWGNALSRQAKTKAGEAADRLFQEAGRKYAEAHRLKPDDHRLLSNWGAALLGQASMKEGLVAEHLLGQARRKLFEAERMHDGSGAYNLACVEAMEGNTREAVRWLQVFRSSGERLSRARLAADKDFDRVRNQPEFVSLVESLPEK